MREREGESVITAGLNINSGPLTIWFIWQKMPVIVNTLSIKRRGLFLILKWSFSFRVIKLSLYGVFWRKGEKSEGETKQREIEKYEEVEQKKKGHHIQIVIWKDLEKTVLNFSHFSLAFAKESFKEAIS